MEQSQINLNFLKKSKKMLHPGDVFILQPKNHPYYFGRVISTNAKVGDFDKAILIYIFNEHSNNKNYLPILNPNNLLLPPILINRLPWSKGYFETIYNKEIEKNEILKIHCFRKINGKNIDEYGNYLSPSIEPIGTFGLWSYGVVNDEISKILGIPLTPN